MQTIVQYFAIFFFYLSASVIFSRNDLAMPYLRKHIASPVLGRGAIFREVKRHISRALVSSFFFFLVISLPGGNAVKNVILA